MFDSLRGIRKERDVQERKPVALDYLLEREEKVRKEFPGMMKDISPGRIKKDVYTPLYRSCQNLEEFTASDLQTLVSAKANNDYDENESRALGLYTGVLLHLLTEREQQQGREAEVEIDLHGGSFSYLFYFAERADYVQVKNVVGVYTCAYMGSYDGRVQELYIIDCEGNCAAFGAGSHSGEVDTLVISGNKGNNAASCAGSYNGKVGTLVINGNKGVWAATWMGGNSGKVGTLALYNAGTNAGFEAEAERILTGDEALRLYEQIMQRKEIRSIMGLRV